MKKHLSTFFIACLTILGTAMGFAQQNASVKGKVLTNDGEAAENVTVSIPTLNLTALTDAYGEYQIINIKPGSYTLKTSSPRHSSQEKNLTLIDGDVLYINFTVKVTSEKEKEKVKPTDNSEIFIENAIEEPDDTLTNKYTKELSEYVSRTKLRKVENPQSYHVITKELISDQVINNQNEALKNATGIYLLSEFNQGANFTSRGFLTQSQVRNGIAGQIASSRVDVANIDYIEVIKGPSATLFGNTLTSYGGLMNRVTKQPTDSLHGEINAQGGSYGFHRIAADINTPLNEDKTALFRLNTSYNSTNTFQDNGFSKNFFFAPSFSYKVNDKLSFKLEAEISNVDATSPHQILFGKPTTAGIFSADDIDYDYKRSFMADEFVMSTKTVNIFGEIKYKMSNKWTSQTLFSTNSNKTKGPQTWLLLLANHSFSRNAINLNNNDNGVDFQQNFTGKFKIGKLDNTLLLGGDIYHNESKYNYGYMASGNNPTKTDFDIVDYTAPSPIYNNFNVTNVNQRFINGMQNKSRNSFTTYSAYVSDILNITDKLSVSAAVRFTHYDNKGNYSPVLDSIIGNYSQNAISPKFGAVYQIVKDKISIFANYQNSFRNMTGVNEDGDTFKPEQANQIEGGIKINAFKNRLSATLSYYDIKVKDIVRNNPDNNAFLIQDGTQYSKGFEAEIVAMPIDGLNIIVGYSMNDSKYSDVNITLDDLRPETAGPKTLINFWVSYSLQDTAMKGLGLGVGGNSVSKNLVYNRSNYDLNNQFIGSEEFVLPSYTVFNASIYYDQPEYRIAVKVNNLTDELYFNGLNSVNVQAPRTFMASVTYKF